MLTLISVNLNQANAAGDLSVEIIAAPNLIVDSNVLSPSSYQPIVATVIGKFCNTSAANDLTNVSASIGDFTGGTPGIYPVSSNPTIGSLEITIGGGWSGVPQVFIDFDGDDTAYSLSEIVLRDSSGNPLTMPLAPGVHRVYFDVPAGTFDGVTPTNPIFLRVRLSTDGGLGVIGLAANGEIEDYRHLFGPTAVRIQSLTAENAILTTTFIHIASLLMLSLLTLFLYARVKQMTLKPVPVRRKK
ncbi:MAG: hypothetical protein GY803_17740 [Chloroflexi bacterium]|nr:hypothetical protein [Chloroflexota bacterium]